MAKLAAAKFQPRLQHLCEEYEELVDRLDRFQSEDMGAREFRSIYDRIANPPEWTLGELGALAPLPADCALKFSAGLGKLNATRLFMRDRANDQKMDYRSDQFRLSSASEAAVMLDEGVGLLYDACTTMVAIVN